MRRLEKGGGFGTSKLEVFDLPELYTVESVV
jgi:hypothetical protein